MIKRALGKKIKDLAREFPVIAIVGPRQSGKTTLVKNLFQDTDYVSLEDLDTREFAVGDPKGFLANYNKGVIIDEIQRAPNFFSYMQGIVNKSNRAGQFIIIGSQNFLLQENISQTLAGRVAILRLLPFSLMELEKTKHKSNYAEDFIFKGFYPRIYDKNISPVEWYPNYIETYVERDLRLIKNIADLSAFQRFLKMCAGRIGQMLNLSSLGNDCGITHNTVKSWLSILESSYIIFLLRPYYRNFNKRLIKMPKLYFYDTGLACSLIGIHQKSQLDGHYLKGGLFESFVLSEIIKHRFNEGKEAGCYYWKDKTGNEIDCILELSNLLLQIEIKSGSTIVDDFFAGIKYWNKIADKKSQNPYLIYNGKDTQIRSSVKILSWKNINSIFIS